MTDLVNDPWVVTIVGGVLASLIATLLFGDLAQYRQMLLGPLIITDPLKAWVFVARFAVTVDVADAVLGLVGFVGSWHGPGTGYLISGTALLVNWMVKSVFLVFHFLRFKDYYSMVLLVANEGLCWIAPFGQLINILPLYHYVLLRQFWAAHVKAGAKEGA